MGQIPRSIERISSSQFTHMHISLKADKTENHL